MNFPTSLSTLIAAVLVLTSSVRLLAEDDVAEVRAVDIGKVFSGSQKVMHCVALRNSARAVTGPKTADPRRNEYRDVIREAQEIAEELKLPDLTRERHLKLTADLAMVKRHGKLIEREFNLADKERRAAEKEKLAAKRAELLLELRAVAETLAVENGWGCVIFYEATQPHSKPIIRDEGAVTWVSKLVLKRWNAIFDQERENASQD